MTAEYVPDDINPRSHDEECLKSKVARDIEDTLRNCPWDFCLSNRGGYVLADQVKYRLDRELIEVRIADPELQCVVIRLIVAA